MKTTTQKEIKRLINAGHAINLENINEYVTGLTPIKVSTGTYGANGLLLKDSAGKIYAVPSRSTTLFEYY